MSATDILTAFFEPCDACRSAVELRSQLVVQLEQTSLVSIGGGDEQLPPLDCARCGNSRLVPTAEGRQLIQALRAWLQSPLANADGDY